MGNFRRDPRHYHLGLPQTLGQRESKGKGKSTTKMHLSALLSSSSLHFSSSPKGLGTARSGFAAWLPWEEKGEEGNGKGKKCRSGEGGGVGRKGRGELDGPCPPIKALFLSSLFSFIFWYYTCAARRSVNEGAGGGDEATVLWPTGLQGRWPRPYPASVRSVICALHVREMKLQHLCVHKRNCSIFIAA